MSVATASSYPSVTAAVLSGGYWLPTVRSLASPFVANSQKPSMRIEVADFDLVFETVLSDIHWNDDHSVITAEAVIDPGLVALLTLKTQIVDTAGSLQIREVSINFDVTEHRPRPHFLAASLYAVLALGGPIQVGIPDLGSDVTANFSMRLREVSTLLQSRQTYYGLMAIERANDLRLQIPEQMSEGDINAISFAYHAIVERTFDWLAKLITLPVPATIENLSWINNLQSMDPGRSAHKLTFGPTPASRMIFGQTVALGPETIFIDDGVFQDFEGVRCELAQLDGHIVPIVVRPLSGICTYSLPQAPRLPDTPWDGKIEAFIRLEDRLNERLTESYNELAASTIAGLTPDEVKIITAKPILEEDAHLVKE